MSVEGGKFGGSFALVEGKFGGETHPSLTWGPREMFSCAGRATFFGGILSVG